MLKASIPTGALTHEPINIPARASAPIVKLKTKPFVFILLLLLPADIPGDFWLLVDVLIALTITFPF
jgi:hypothetical protein